MKRFWCILFSLILLFSVTAFGCKDFSYGEPCADNKHTYGEYVYQNDATCFEDGTEIARCTNPYCSAKLTRVKEGSQLTHQLEKHPVCAPTCYSYGYSSSFYECIHCHTYYSKNNAIDENILTSLDHLIIEKAAHSYQLSFTVDISATAYDPGIKSRHCVNYEHCGSRTEITTIPSWKDDNQWGKPK